MYTLNKYPEREHLSKCSDIEIEHAFSDFDHFFSLTEKDLIDDIRFELGSMTTDYFKLIATKKA